jgi:uncharacterized protein involved in exopolysaccharide biosynthesis
METINSYEKVGQMKEDEGPSLRDTLNILFRRKRILLFLNIFLPLAVLGICFLVDPVYESSAKVIVTAKKENATLLQGPKDSSAAMYVNLNVDETDLNSEMELLKSLDLWIRTVKTLNLSQTGEQKGFIRSTLSNLKRGLGFSSEKAGASDRADRQIAELLLRDFKVIPGVKSKVLDLSFKSNDPVQAQKILATLLDLYIPYHLEVYSLPGAQGFFSGQGDMYKERYEKADAELADFKRKWGISLPEKQKSEIITTIKQIEDALVELKANRSQYEYMLSALNQGILPTGQLASSMQRGNENTVINIIISQLIRAEQKQLQSGETFSAESRDHRASSDLVKELNRRLKDAMQSEVQTMAAKQKSLEASLKIKQDELQVLEDKGDEARRLQLDVNIAKERYLQYVTKEEEARLENLKVGKHLVNVSIVTKPFLPTDPIFPKTLLYVLGAFFLSFPLGIGLILILNFFDHTFQSPREMESVTDMRVLASIGNLKKMQT